MKFRRLESGVAKSTQNPRALPWKFRKPAARSALRSAGLRLRRYQAPTIENTSQGHSVGSASLAPSSQ